MKKLILIRHAKSSWDTITDDRSRTISPRGIHDANLVSGLISPLLPKKFMVWSSPAKRTRETATIFCHNMDIPLDCILYDEDLYTFDYKVLENKVKNCNNIHDNLIIFGHNDAITKFVNKFGDSTFDNVPTSGVVILNFDVDSWKDISKGKTELNIFPRDLKQNEYKLIK